VWQVVVFLEYQNWPGVWHQCALDTVLQFREEASFFIDFEIKQLHDYLVVIKGPAFFLAHLVEQSEVAVDTHPYLATHFVAHVLDSVKFSYRDAFDIAGHEANIYDCLFPFVRPFDILNVEAITTKL
jgi:hypothetical protein